MFLPTIAAVAMTPANEYVTIFRDASSGTAKFHVMHSEATVEGRKMTELNVKDQKAWLTEDLTTGEVTLIIGSEAFTAPKAKDKEPVASLSYYSKVYANVAAPKKKKNILGGLDGNLLGVLTGGLGSSLLGSAMNGSLGAMSGQMLANTAAYSLQGLAVREMTQSLGRATSYTAMTDGDSPMMVRETTKVDKTTMVETLYLKKRSTSIEMPTPGTPKAVTAPELFEKFTQFVSQGSDDPKEDKK